MKGLFLVGISWRSTFADSLLENYKTFLSELIFFFPVVSKKRVFHSWLTGLDAYFLQICCGNYHDYYSHMSSPLRPPTNPSLLSSSGVTCTGEAMLEDVVAAHITPGILASTFEDVPLTGLLFHPGVLISGWEDGPHIWGSEPPLPASHWPSMTFHLVPGGICLVVSSVRGAHVRVHSLTPSRLEALETGRLRRRMPTDGFDNHCALVGFGDPHFSSRWWPSSLRCVAEWTGGSVDVNSTHGQGRVIRDRGARRDVFPTLVHDVKHHALTSFPTSLQVVWAVLNNDRQVRRHRRGDDTDWWRGGACLLSVSRLGRSGVQGNGLNVITIRDGTFHRGVHTELRLGTHKVKEPVDVRRVHLLLHLNKYRIWGAA